MNLKLYFTVLAKTSWLWGIPILATITFGVVEVIQERRKGNDKQRRKR